MNYTREDGALTSCDQCEVLSINGCACHETGCVNSWRDPVTGEPNPVECYECGCDFVPEERRQRYCSYDCVSY